MKLIKEYEERGSMIAYFTDYGEFVYPGDRYATLDDVEREIEKKVSWRLVKASKDKKIKILAALKDKDVKEKELIIDG